MWMIFSSPVLSGRINPIRQGVAGRTAILTPVQSVGVMGDERTYENVVVLRAVTSVDGTDGRLLGAPAL